MLAGILLSQAFVRDYQHPSTSVPRDPREMTLPRLMVILVGKELNQVPVMETFSVRRLNSSNSSSNNGTRQGISNSLLHNLEQLKLIPILPFPLNLLEGLKPSLLVCLRQCLSLQAVHIHLIVRKVRTFNPSWLGLSRIHHYVYKNNLLLAQRFDQACLSFLDLQPLEGLKLSTPLILYELDLSRS
jgi:hypothetical protein